MLHDEAKSITQTFQLHAFSKHGHTSVKDLKVIHPHHTSIECLLKHSPTKHLDVWTPPVEEFKHPGCPHQVSVMKIWKEKRVLSHPWGQMTYN